MKLVLSSRLWQLIKFGSFLPAWVRRLNRGISDRVRTLIPLIQVPPSPILAYSQILALALATCDVQPVRSFINSGSARVNSSVGFAYLLASLRL